MCSEELITQCLAKWAGSQTYFIMQLIYSYGMKTGWRRLRRRFLPKPQVFGRNVFLVALEEWVTFYSLICPPASFYHIYDPVFVSTTPNTFNAPSRTPRIFNFSAVHENDQHKYIKKNLLLIQVHQNIRRASQGTFFTTDDKGI